MSRPFDPVSVPRLPSAAVGFYFQALFADGLVDLPPSSLRELQAMEPGELIFVIEHLMANGGIGIALDDDALALAQHDGEDASALTNIAAPDFAGRLLVALGREAGMTGLLLQLIKMGALGRWVKTSVRGIANASGGILTSSNVNFNARRLVGMGIVAIEKGQYTVDASALDQLLARPKRG